MKIKNLVFIAIVVLLLVMPILIKAQTYNQTLIALNQSRIDLQDLAEAGFNIARINDTLREAEQLFTAQSALEESGGTPDYSLILERTEEITELRNQAEEINDELNALEARLKEIPVENEVFSLLENAKKEFNDQRYEMVSDLIEEVYIKISEQDALQTRFRAIYAASTKTILGFFKKRWKSITFVIVSIVVFYLAFRKRVAIFLIKRKISNLNFEKEVLGKLTKNAQYDYFHLFKIPEELYHIRIEKFGELIRDIDRKIPLLLEEKAKVKGIVQEEETKAKKLNKELIVVIISLFAFVIIGIILGIYFKFISYTGFLESVQKIGLEVNRGLSFIIDAYGTAALVIVVMMILALLFAILIFIYIWKRKKEAENKQKNSEETKLEYEKRFVILQSLKIFISNKIDRLKILSKNIKEMIKLKREYKKLSKRKREEELPRIRYLRKQKIILFKRNLLQKIKSIFKPNSFPKKEEEPKVKNKQPDLKESLRDLESLDHKGKEKENEYR